jgi:predicted nucleic acid-binding protein
MYRYRLQELATVLKKDNTDYWELRQALMDFKALVLELSEVDINSEEARKDIHFENGKALGMTWAALCIDELMRTKMFVKGLFKAIEHAQQQKARTLHVLYAGCGPFATLILPIMATYSAQEVQFTLLEINEVSASNAKQVIGKLGFSDYIKGIHIVDATQYVLDTDVDIVLSETMQHGLVKEQQVPIVMNLMKQVTKETILVPEKVTVELGLINYNTLLRRTEETPETAYCTRIGELFELSAEKIATYADIIEQKDKKIVFPKKTFVLPKEQINRFPQLSMLTEIQVFGNEKLVLNQCSLTMPVRLNSFSETEADDRHIEIGYKIDEVPGFDYVIL